MNTQSLTPLTALRNLASFAGHTWGSLTDEALAEAEIVGRHYHNLHRTYVSAEIMASYYEAVEASPLKQGQSALEQAIRLACYKYEDAGVMGWGITAPGITGQSGCETLTVKVGAAFTASYRRGGEGRWTLVLTSVGDVTRLKVEFEDGGAQMTVTCPFGAPRERDFARMAAFVNAAFGRTTALGQKIDGALTEAASTLLFEGDVSRAFQLIEAHLGLAEGEYPTACGHLLAGSADEDPLVRAMDIFSAAQSARSKFVPVDWRAIETSLGRLGYEFALVPRPVLAGEASL